MVLDKNRTASFDVDAQNTFTPVCADELPVPEGDQIVDELNLQASKARYRVGSKDAHSEKALWVANHEQPAFSALPHEHADLAWPLHAVPGSKGFELIEGLPAPKEYDYFIWKGVELDMHPYGACYHDLKEKMSTGVIEYLKASGVETIIVGGLATDYCVKHTAFQLRKAGFQVIVNLAGVRGVLTETTQKALDDMAAADIILIESAKKLEVS